MNYKRIEITDGYVEMMPFITKGARLRSNEVLFGSSTLNQKEGVKLVNMDKSVVALVVALIRKIYLNGEDKPIDDTFLDEISNEDFDKIKDYVDSLAQDIEEEKKKKD